MSSVGGTGPRVMCSDCCESANIYSRTREYCPYTYVAEEDVLDQTLSSLMGQVPKEAYLTHPPQDATVLESLIASVDRELSAFPTNHERMNEKRLSSSQMNSEALQHPLWNVNRDLGLPHPPFSQQPGFDSPQLHPKEGLAERDPDCSSSPVSCHRLQDHAVGSRRTRDIQNCTEGT